MSITAEQAIAAARTCSSSRGSLRWSDDRVSVTRGTWDDRDCWIVTTDAPFHVEQGQPDWFDTFTDTRISYLVEVTSGECVAVRVGQFYHPLLA